MIYELLIWTNGEDKELTLNNQIITQSIINETLSQAKEGQRLLLAQARLAKFNPSNTERSLSKVGIYNLAQQDDLVGFLEFCQTQVNSEGTSLFRLTLQYLLSHNKQEILPTYKISQLFLALLKEEPEKTLTFYHQNQELFKTCHDINNWVAAEISQTELRKSVSSIKSELAYLTENLKEQKNPLGIVSLFREYIDNTERFTALLLWLLQREATTEAILGSHLLHDFLKYNLYTLSLPDNSLTQLYTLLAFFPQANELIESANLTCCGERGFELYTLSGIMEKEKTLAAIPENLPVFEFTVTETNFANLHALFGPSFLIAATIWYLNHKDKSCFHLLKQAINQETMAIEQLSSLINYIAKSGSPKTLKEFAKLVDDKAIQRLISLNKGAVLYLLPYNPLLFDKINQNHLEDYIHQLTVANTSDPEIVFQLMSLFTVLVEKKHPASEPLFEAIIDNLILHPIILEDTRFLQQLDSYPKSEMLLIRRSERLQQQISQCIDEQITNNPLRPQHYQLMEDKWLEISRHLVIINQIKPHINYNLHDKYELQTHIAEVCFIRNGNSLDIENFVQALSLEMTESGEKIPEYERILIEILAQIDDTSVREDIIYRLRSAPIERLDWMQKKYGVETIFLKAARHGNIGLIKTIPLLNDPEMLNEAILLAAHSRHWEFVNYMVETRLIPRKETLATITLLAAEHGELGIITNLCKRCAYSLSRENIETILEKAVTNGHLNIVAYFCSRFVVKRSVVEQLFKKAIYLEHFDIINCLGNLNTNAPSVVSIENAFEQAAQNNRLELIKCLCSLPNTPRVKAIERAFKKTSQLGNLAITLYLCTSENISKSARTEALIEAITANQLPIVKHFCNLSPKLLEQQSIEWALCSAVKVRNPSIVKYLCTESPQKPHKRAIQTALLLAAKTGQADVIDYFCSMQPTTVLNQQTMKQALLLAVKFKQFTVIQHLCVLTKDAPQYHDALRTAYRKATSTKQTAIADYLYERLHAPCATKEKPVSSSSKEDLPLINHGIFRKDNKNVSVTNSHCRSLLGN
ncbi:MULTISPECIES: ankyrin repeat domain-containing protein [unclassified Legionella]|uniref:ankyrin repeat domain-containing protein n=1 Tax=unclassified Legionella TaxID=2622702 RepID=UPI00105553CE|nr:MULTISPECIES: ankyrin repeat domain-containing protein [unclassified Legionella]MDI9818372.1 ankyrin repeat domain-containing protein [Legionella sp. PL877]